MLKLHQIYVYIICYIYIYHNQEKKYSSSIEIHRMVWTCWNCVVLQFQRICFNRENYRLCSKQRFVSDVVLKMCSNLAPKVGHVATSCFLGNPGGINAKFFVQWCFNCGFMMV